MALSDAEIRSFRGANASYRRSDEKGLYLEVPPNGSRLWRFKFRHKGKEKRLALGSYPDVSLAEARRRRDTARSQVAAGIDPSEERKRVKRQARLEAGNTFEEIAKEFINSKMMGERRSDATLVKARWFLDLLRPAIGNRLITAIEPPELLEPLRKLEKKGHYETTRRCRAFASRVFRFAIATGRAKADPRSGKIRRIAPRD